MAFFVINTRDDLKFYHGFGQASLTVREIRNEYQRLAQHTLPTLVVKVIKFCKSVPDLLFHIMLCIIFFSLLPLMQTLGPHSEDISIDTIMN